MKLRRWCSAGRRVKVDKPRVRSLAGEEVGLPAWSAFSGDELLSEMALERMLAGLSTRHYPAGLEPVGDDLDASATTRSSVSRRFVACTTRWSSWIRPEKSICGP